MSRLMRIIVAALVIGACGASLASARPHKSIRVSAAQRALTTILAKYDNLFKSAPNDIQQKNVTFVVRPEIEAAS